MRRKLTSIAIPLLLPLLLASHSAWAEGYLGLGAGVAESTIDELETSTAGRVYAGYLFSRNYGIEAGYIDFGEFDADNASGGEVAATGVYVALAGFNRITDIVELTGKLGAMQFDHEVRTGGPVKQSTDGTSAILGIGVNFYLTPSIALGGEFTHVNDIEDEHINSVWVQIHIKPWAGD